MPRGPLRIAFLGGVPASLGGGGLEIQMRRTAEALRDRGHQVFDVALEEEPRPFDVLHAFGSEVDVWHHLSHWRRNPAPLVISPVLVVRAGTERAYTVAASRVPWRSLAPRMRREALLSADLLVALTRHEQRLLVRLAPGVTSMVIGNGVDRLEPLEVDLAGLGISSPYALLLGTVSTRKRQLETVAGLAAAGVQPVVVGGFEGDEAASRAFDDKVADAGGTWLGELHDQRLVRQLVREARALVHLSSAEGQSLAVLEALAEGTPVVCSPIPSNVELYDRYPGLVRLCKAPDELGSALVDLRVPAHRDAIPTWDDVAAALEHAYASLLEHS